MRAGARPGGLVVSCRSCGGSPWRRTADAVARTPAYADAVHSMAPLLSAAQSSSFLTCRGRADQPRENVRQNPLHVSPPKTPALACCGRFLSARGRHQVAPRPTLISRAGLVMFPALPASSEHSGPASAWACRLGRFRLGGDRTRRWGQLFEATGYGAGFQRPVTVHSSITIRQCKTKTSRPRGVWGRL